MTKYESIVTFPHMLSFWPRWSVAESLPRDFFLTATCSWFGVCVCVWRPTVAANFSFRLLFLHLSVEKDVKAGSRFVLDEDMRSQRLCKLRRFSECRFLPSAVPTGNKNTCCEFFLDFPSWSATVMWHLPWASARGILHTKDRLGRSVWSVRFELVRQARVPALNSGKSGECQAIIFSAHQRRTLSEGLPWKRQNSYSSMYFHDPAWFQSLIGLTPFRCSILPPRDLGGGCWWTCCSHLWKRNPSVRDPLSIRHSHGQVLIRRQGTFICHSLLIWHHIAMKLSIKTLSGVALACLSSDATLRLGWFACVARIECFRRLAKAPCH